MILQELHDNNIDVANVILTYQAWHTRARSVEIIHYFCSQKHKAHTKIGQLSLDESLASKTRNHQEALKR